MTSEDIPSRLKSLQQLCTGPDFVAGEVYGLRQWFADAGGNLRGHFGHRWAPGHPITAECLAYVPRDAVRGYFTVERPEEIFYAASIQAQKWAHPIISARQKSRPADTIFLDQCRLTARVLPSDSRVPTQHGVDMDLSWLLDPSDRPSDLNIPMRLRGYRNLHVYLSLEVPEEPHPVAHPRCTCGIYAYYDVRGLKMNSVYGTEPQVFGLVKAYGKMTLGTTGFRAEKAEVLALVRPIIPEERCTEVLNDWVSTGVTIVEHLGELIDFAQRAGFVTERPQ